MIQTQEKNRISAVNIVFLISILISVVVPFLPLDFIMERPALQLIFSQLIFALPAVVYMIVCKLPYKETVRFRKMKVTDMALCILFAILVQPLLTLLNALSMVFATNTMSTYMVEFSEQIPFLGALFLMAVVPGVLEETVYRGLYYNAYAKINPWKAALLSGFLFGLMHGNLNQFCYATVLGFLFAMLMEATGSILSTMLVHFWTNAGSVVLMYLYPKLYEFMQAFYRMYKENGQEELAAAVEISMGDMTLSSSEWMSRMMEQSNELVLTVPDVLLMYGPSAVISGILAFLVYRLLARRSGNWERIRGFFGRKRAVEVENPEPWEVKTKKRMLTIPLVIGIVIGIAFMIFCEVVVRMG